MHIRSADISDIPAIARIHVLAWRAAYGGYMPTELLHSLDIEQRTSDWQGWLSEPGPGTTYVVEDSKSLVGFCVFGPTRDDDSQGESVGEILSINIHPDHWRRGCGRYLCQAVFKEAEHRQWRSLALWVLKANERAHLFYQSLGFSRDGSERVESDLTDYPLVEIRYQKIM